MGSLFGADNSDAEEALAEQEAATALAEANQAKELAARRRAGSSGGGTSKTLFSQVLGTDEAIGKTTTLGD